jgi:hypothetical protein
MSTKYISNITVESLYIHVKDTSETKISNYVIGEHNYKSTPEMRSPSFGPEPTLHGPSYKYAKQNIKLPLK